MQEEKENTNNALLEIEIMQLSALFNNGIDEHDLQELPNQVPVKISCTNIDELNKLDLYNISWEEQSTAFIIAAYKAYLGYEPSHEDIRINLDYIKSNNNMYNFLIDILVKKRETIINNYNQKREQSIELTLKNIKRWSKPKLLSSWR